MRAAPPVRISLRRFGVWRAAVALTAASGLAVIGGWIVVRPEPVDAILFAVLAVVASAMGGSLLQLWRVAPVELRWDGRSWHLGPTLDRMTPGEVEVAIDLGAWLLLRFTEASLAAGPGGRRRVRWLPVQRRGLGSSWHALRCAVYSPRPGVPSTSSTLPDGSDR